MGPFFLLLTFVLVGAQFAVPRRNIFAPLIIATFLFPNTLTNIGGLGFSACRLLLMAGVIRAISDRQFTWSRRNPLDFAILIWACFALLSTFFHHPTREENPIMVRLSLVYDISCTYLFTRAYLRSFADFHRVIRCIAAVTIPLALIMLFEASTHRSFYGLLGAVVEDPWTRIGRIRVAGPFGGSILAGTAGAVAAVMSTPLFWDPNPRNRRLALTALFSCLIIVYCSASSGPVMTFAAGFGALGVWRWRRYTRQLRIAVITVLFLLHLVMNGPVWDLISKIHIVGGSTSWARSEFITQALNHLGEWWFMGTDYTRHWMPYGIQWTASHTDITNYYIKMGVIGGLPLMLAFIWILYRTFQMLGRAMRTRGISSHSEFMLWTIGSALFANAINFLSVSYYDQNYVQVYLLVGAVPGLALAVRNQQRASAEPAGERPSPRRRAGPIPAQTVA